MVSASHGSKSTSGRPYSLYNWIASISPNFPIQMSRSMNQIDTACIVPPGHIMDQPIGWLFWVRCPAQTSQPGLQEKVTYLATLAGGLWSWYFFRALVVARWKRHRTDIANTILKRKRKNQGPCLILMCILNAYMYGASYMFNKWINEWTYKGINKINETEASATPKTIILIPEQEGIGTLLSTLHKPEQFLAHSSVPKHQRGPS